MNDAKASILSGAFNVFDGVIETNTGDTIGVEGATLDDATITGGINWYYKNVSVLQDDGSITDGTESLQTSEGETEEDNSDKEAE